MISWLINLARRLEVTSCQESGERIPSQKYLFVLVRKYLFARGLRFRKNDKRYPGRPDVVLPKYKTAVFVHGCFWHLHEGCKYAKMPKSNVEYWEEKLYKNRERDARNQEELKAMGWTVLTVWECELKKDKREETLEILYDKITSQVNDE